MSKRAIILAGGKGTRLRPYTTVLPKPLMPIGEYPILEVIVKQLVSSGFTHITMAVNHQAQLIQAFFQDGSKWNTKIDYSLEDKPLGTMGPLKLVSDLPSDFLVMNGDVLTDIDFSAFYKIHVESKSIFTISSKKRKQLIDYGVLETDGRGLLIGFREKPTQDYEVSMGVYMVNQAALDFIPKDSIFGFDHLMLKLIEINRPISVLPHEGYWLDIGRPDDYEKAIDEFETMKDTLFHD
ncbi:NTP transferase domain-containing protein [Leptospira interrogans]|uniref:Nucleotidyl transferase domain-containing protein n=3 Tax=Leptospira interrogans TaxID=173 RepID=Q9S4H3_LEPIR|nr:sugar phosphate nucleotidyltransferase [Leptospira interrogans]EMM79650.1 nucleotidyl transferase [Leptospira interrogans str. 2006001854]AAD52169.1 unknown [Leptospira interrogans]ALE38995.1 mannose-1-phosphate guanyltransferase [Leptospira interrogans serovar Hardjo str. Norma]ALO00194.1 putative mannose-1-phosphate guanyltransferase [Leptospira interrogans serovar Hardjo-prajitno]EJP14491.1 nucleotidyl transferase [Leptospira interrogans str. FPW2026]